jgi:hypothetical protein
MRLPQLPRGLSRLGRHTGNLAQVLRCGQVVTAGEARERVLLRGAAGSTSVSKPASRRTRRNCAARSSGFRTAGCRSRSRSRSAGEPRSSFVGRGERDLLSSVAKRLLRASSACSIAAGVRSVVKPTVT